MSIYLDLRTILNLIYFSISYLEQISIVKQVYVHYLSQAQYLKLEYIIFLLPLDHNTPHLYYNGAFFHSIGFFKILSHINNITFLKSPFIHDMLSVMSFFSVTHYSVSGTNSNYRKRKIFLQNQLQRLKNLVQDFLSLRNTSTYKARLDGILSNLV